MTYFNNCKNREDLKNEYKLLAKRHHPDLGGDVETMKLVNTEYAEALKNVLKNGEFIFSETEIDDIIKNDEELRNKLNSILSVIGTSITIDVELCGTWLWISGDTKPIKEDLKRNGLSWARKKEAWYFHTGTFRRRSKGSYSLDDIRLRHGSHSVTGNRKIKSLV